MPKVPDTHLAARREQILAAARRCFSRNGFHATSMQDVIDEAGLSVGAVYRYFRSKDELRTAVAEETVGGILAEVGAIAAHEPPLPLAESMSRLLTVVEPLLQDPDPMARIAVQAWGEALRDPDLGEFVRQGIGRLRANFTSIASQAQRAGDLPPSIDPAVVAPVLMSLLPGYLLQRVHTGGPDLASYLAGIRALFARPDSGSHTGPSGGGQ